MLTLSSKRFLDKVLSLSLIIALEVFYSELSFTDLLACNIVLHCGHTFLRRIFPSRVQIREDNKPTRVDSQSQLLGTNTWACAGMRMLTSVRKWPT